MGNSKSFLIYLRLHFYTHSGVLNILFKNAVCKWNPEKNFTTLNLGKTSGSRPIITHAASRHRFGTPICVSLTDILHGNYLLFIVFFDIRKENSSNLPLHRTSSFDILPHTFPFVNMLLRFFLVHL